MKSKKSNIQRSSPAQNDSSTVDLDLKATRMRELEEDYIRHSKKLQHIANNNAKRSKHTPS